MKDWMRFSVAFWHTFRGTGGDPFGAATKMWPWEDGSNSLAMAKRRSKINCFVDFFIWSIFGQLCSLLSFFVVVRANFEFLEKLGVDRWCFHDRDIAPDGETLEVIGIILLYLSHNVICNLMF